MEKSEKAPEKANSSVPDIAFYQLKMEKEKRVIAFVENDSEEHVGKLSRKGGEILLPGVFQQKTRIADESTKAPPGQNRKSKVQLIVDIPNSDTELETLLFCDGSTGEFRCIVREESDNQARKSAGKKIVGMTDSKVESAEFYRLPDESTPSGTSEIILQTEQLIDVKEVTEEDSLTTVPHESDKKGG